jgi:tagatose-1,6-bisphosphate aldolase non-catalytic subunit AgaZ/GatZ
MPLWRCPHCGTPQAETARCWVCHRSSTSCGTCRNFRASVAANVGYCGLDRGRLPLRGDEIRACWEELPAAAAIASTDADPAAALWLDSEA